MAVVVVSVNYIFGIPMVFRKNTGALKQQTNSSIGHRNSLLYNKEK